jgi:hypothetical protein
MQEEPLGIMKLDASSRFAGALKGEAIPPEAGCRTLNNAADESLRLARRVKINEK